MIKSVTVESIVGGGVVVCGLAADAFEFCDGVGSSGREGEIESVGSDPLEGVGL